MNRSRLGVTAFAVVSGLLIACSSDSSDGGNATEVDPSAAAAAGTATATVDCTHPGAGPKRDDGTCECPVKRDITGDWAGKRTCAEGTACPARNVGDDYTFTQKGNAITGESSRSKITGTMCGDYVVYTGSQKDGSNPECGQLRFSDDGHFLRDSCYVANGACTPSFGTGCKDQKGWCTGTGARKPEAAADIKKQLCL